MTMCPMNKLSEDARKIHEHRWMRSDYKGKLHSSSAAGKAPWKQEACLPARARQSGVIGKRLVRISNRLPLGSRKGKCVNKKACEGAPRLTAASTQLLR